MTKLLSVLSCLLLLTSCAGEYNIAGNSAVSYLDGRMLYLRTTPPPVGVVDMASTIQDSNSGHCIDSCKVEHGRFSFVGNVDSVMMALIYMDNECMMPMVIENGNLSVQVDNMGQRVTGSPLNERLYKFIEKKNRLENEMWELQQKCIRMMREGASPEELAKVVNRKFEKLNKRSQELETKFVIDNYDNVLGPGFFMLLCNQYPTPIMTEQINRIVKDAPSDFLGNPYVQMYVRVAKARMAKSEDK